MLDLISEKARTSPYSDYDTGKDARFMRVNDTWGFKLYYYESTRDQAYNKQKAVHDIGWAPAVGEKFEIDTPDGMSYGFVTESALETVHARHPHIYSRYNMLEAYPEKLENMREAARSIGLSPSDLYAFNFGFMDETEDRLVVIDPTDW